MGLFAINKYFILIENITIRLITYLENLQIPLINYFLTFACILTLRNFLESFSHSYLTNLFFINYSATFLTSEFVHFSLFYTLIASLLVVTLHSLTQEKIKNIIKVILPSFIVILSVPCIDLIVSGGKGHHISYLFPNTDHSLFYYYFTFFGSAQNISFGMRLEIFIVLLWAFFYLYTKQKNILLTFASLASIYSTVFFIIATPYIIKYLATILHLNIQINSKVAVNYLLLLLFPAGVGLSLLANKKIFIALVKDLRWLRLLHFELMLILGITLVIKNFSILLLPNFIFLSISILFFWLFAIITNNISDQAIDCISNPQRPLITKEIKIEQYKNIAYAVLFCSLVYALAVTVISFFIIGGIIFAYYIYSMPPIRLKRIPVFSKTIISLVSLAIVLLGYINTQGNWHEFPKSLVWIFLVGFTLAINFIDIKDSAGDKANRIMTLPTLLTPAWAKFFISIAFALTSIAFYFYLQNFYLLPLLLIAGVLGGYFINQKDYQEWKVFSVYLSTMIMLIIYLLLRNLWG